MGDPHTKKTPVEESRDMERGFLSMKHRTPRPHPWAVFPSRQTISFWLRAKLRNENTAVRLLKKVYHFVRDLKYSVPFFFSKKKPIADNGLLLISHELYKHGAEKLLYHLAKRFVSQGLPVCVVSPRHGPMWREFNELFALRVLSGKRFSKFIQYLNQEKDYHHVICNTVVTGGCVPELKAAGYRAVSLVHEMKHLIQTCHWEPLCDAIAEQADAVVFPSSYVYDSFCECLSQKNAFTFHIKDQGLFNTTLANANKHEAKEAVFAKYGLPEGRFIVLNVATAEMRKGLDLFLDVALAAQEKELPVSFIWVGDGIEQALAQLANGGSRYRLEDIKNLILPGYINDIHLLNNIYLAADLFFLSSREDPFPSVVLDSFCAKTPVIAFEGCGGFVDIIRSGETGYLIEPFDIEAVVDTICKASKEKKLFERMGMQCSIEVQKHSFDEYCAFLLNLLGRTCS